MPYRWGVGKKIWTPIFCAALTSAFLLVPQTGAAVTAIESTPGTPFGVFDVINPAGARRPRLRLIVMKEPSIYSEASAFLIEPLRNCDNPSLMEPTPTPVPFSIPSWNAATGRMLFRGSNGRFVNGVSGQFVGRDRLEGQFTSTNDRRPNRLGQGPIAPDPYVAERIAEEKAILALAPSSLAASSRRREVPGVYEGRLRDGTPIRLVLMLNRDQDADQWDATLHFGRHDGFSLSGAIEAPGLVRMVREPLQHAFWTSGVTGTIVMGAAGVPEFRGFFVVARTGCVHSFVLRQTRGVVDR